jgi:urease accessory protein
MDLQAYQLQMLFQMTDSMFPSGAFVHSEGLETYVQRGIVSTAEELGEFLRTRLLEGSAKLDMVALHTAMDIYQQEDTHALHDLDERLSAMKTVKESREASERIGRQMLRTVLGFHEDDFLTDYQGAIRENHMCGHQSIVFGLIAAAFQIEKRAALSAYGYSLVSGQVSAALKLMRLGQTQAQFLIHSSQSIIAEAANAALSRTIQDMQSFTPALDIAAMQHQYLFRRLFNS